MLKRILVVTSTLPADAQDPVPAFVQDQLRALKQLHPELAIHVLAPHNTYADTHSQQHAAYQEYRFHYAWPHHLERLAGRGIAPALKAQPWLYAIVPGFMLAEAVATWRLIRRLRPDVLYVHWFMPQAVATFLVARLLGVPLVFTSHASDVAVLKKIPGGRRLVQTICRQVAAYTAVSRQTAERLKWFWPLSNQALESKLSIIPMGTDLPASNHKAPTDLLPGKQVITFIGRLVARKGVADLITAFASVHATNSNTHLVIAGDGQDRAAFAKQIEAAGLTDACTFTGYVHGQTKAQWLARTDILCLPSLGGENDTETEGLPVVLMEGLAAGAIVVASDATGAQEYLQPGVDGYLFKQHDVSALTNHLTAILKLKQPARIAISQSARHTAEHFSWPKVAAAHYTVLQDAYTAYHHARH